MNFKKMILAAVAMVFAFSAHSGELVKKKDSFAAAPPPNFAMAHAVEGQTCHRSGDIGMSLDGLILSCQSGSWKTLNKGEFSGHYATNIYNGCMVVNALTRGCSCPSGSSARATGQYSSYSANDSNSYICL